MTNKACNCPATAQLEKMLSGDVDETTLMILSEHIERCQSCQEQLEQLTKQTCDESAKQMAQASETSPLLRQLMERAMIAKTPAKSMDEYPYFSPSENKKLLGLLGHYEILERVGKGGFGTVFKAFDTKLHRMVAIKVLAPELAAMGRARQRFIREARAAAAVTHENVVTIHGIEEEASPPYIVMQFVSGVSLEKKVQDRGVLELEEILRIGMQIADGLAAAHKQGLVHRDIKPANILLENGIERVKITDFGLARAGDDLSMTASGVISGTPLYMSPEQAEGKAVDHRSDLFSLGSVLYGMCTGRPAFRAATPLAVLQRVATDDPRDIAEINADIPDDLLNLIDTLMAKDPQDRIQNATEVAEILRKKLANMQKQQNIPPKRIQKTSAKKVKRQGSHWSPLIVVLCLLFLFCAGIPILGVLFFVVGYSSLEVHREPPKDIVIPNPIVTKQKPLEEGWTRLFNGRDLTNWKRHPDQPNYWEVKNGLLTGRNFPDDTHLFTERGDFDNFHLQIEARMNKEGNSGISFRAPFSFPVQALFPSGYEVQILHNHPRQGMPLTGSLTGLKNYTEPFLADNEWFVLDIIAKDNHIVVKVNDKTTADFTDEKRRFQKGHIALQAAGPGRTVVQFRRIDIKELKEPDQ